MADEHGYPPDAIDQVRNVAQASGQQVESLKSELARAERVRDAWQSLHRFAGHGWHLHVRDLLQREAATLGGLGGPHAATLDALARTAKEQSELSRRRFPSYLQEACRTAGLPLDSESRHPRYLFDDGFLRLEVDEARGVAHLSDYEGRLADLPADVGAIVEVVLREHRRLFETERDGARFLEKLLHHYQAVTKKERQSEGASIPIRSITSRLGKNEKGFRTDEFLIDLSRLLKNGQTECQGYRLDLEQTKDTNQGMLLHGLGARGYVGLISFRKTR